MYKMSNKIQFVIIEKKNSDKGNKQLIITNTPAIMDRKI
jgi:hypothetical protein